MNTVVSRRSFVAASWTAASAARVPGANDRVQLGIIGSGARGQYLMKRANQAGGLQWVGVCDAWDRRRDEAAALSGAEPRKYGDYRRLLDEKQLDGVIVATWDNNHAQLTIDACRAGKDVYVEKPLTSRPEQGPPLVKAVRETGRIVQVGVQQRNTPHFAEARERFVASGLLGRVHMVRTVWNNNAGYLYRPPAGMEQQPAGLDWNACLGSLPKIPWDPKRFFNRYAYLDLCCGQTGGLFVHMIDVVQWYLGISKPASVVARGGIFQYADGRDTPDNVNLILEYPEKLTVTFEASLTDGVQEENADIVFREGYRFIPAGKTKESQISVPWTRDRHIDNWLDCIRSRKQPNATVDQGHFSAMACHMGNIALASRSPVTWRKEWDI
ncbi:MAG: Gfo/Idh/MocA family oxidoreductase [Acidobacteria bacterium]|nr:Gfo/Idh/MocA family oxidoreductase [Acidobacteriota bacterium]